MATARKILCLGDFHLGARPRRLPSGVDPRAVSVAAAWGRAVEHVLEAGVGLVLLSGDLVDRANRYWEAFGPLGDGLRRLAEAGVEVCAVAGNHDFDVLRRLSEVVGGERFHLLGDRGRWERWTWREEDGTALLHVEGWSFPARDVTDDPLAAHDLAAPEGADRPAPRVGLLHGDLDASPSTNAPLTRAGLEACAGGGFDAWVLGHLHHPRLLELIAGRWALYPGSLQPRDWTEEGPHGAWIVELADGRLGEPEPMPLATVRWETVEADLTGAEDADEAAARAATALREAAEELGESGPGAPEWLLLRLELTGRCAVPRHALERAAEEIVAGAGFAAGDGRARVSAVTVATRPAVDLADVARGDGPPALLADLLLRLEGGGGHDPETADLLARIGRRIEEVHALLPYAALGDSLPEPETRREHLEAAARSLLEGFLAQKAGAG
jgi:DNA repair protein SbcD/Mre11